ncbi:MAG TPA: NAD(P)/FAD-dependent oxidoreductase [Thermomicrobiaceae bacterium]|nr:NAD(P)/FAD-dependent oxidoreductase [Thermomicrobiaceae bacterium]
MSYAPLPAGRPANPRILVVGGGFAGVYTAYELQRRLRHRRPMIDIVNRENFFVFYPLIPEIVSGAIETEHILTPIRLVVPQATLFVGEVSAIDLRTQQVTIARGLEGQPHSLCRHEYDYLVLALGGTLNTSRIPGLSEHAYDVQRLSHAFALRNHLIDILEQANIEPDAAARRRLLTFVVIGGGTTGVEVAAEIRDLVHDALDHYRYLDPAEIRILLVHGGERILPGLAPSLAGFAAGRLRERGVELLLNRHVVAVEPTAVRLDDGSVIPSETVVGSVGLQPNPLVRGLPVPHDRRGRVIVDETLNVPGYPNVWALGDNASVIDPHTGEPYPQTAQHAVREARVVAHNIAARLERTEARRIDYRTRGQLVALGHRSAVADLRGHTFSGFPAWWLWRTYYLAQLPHWEKRLRVAFDWTLDLLFPRSLVQLKVGQHRSPPAPTPASTADASIREARAEPLARA